MSRIRINPPVVTYYPLDRVKFTAEAEPPPAGWSQVTDNGDIKSDFSLEVDSLGSQVSGTGMHELKTGLGVIELMIDDQCRPTSTNLLQIRCFIGDIAGFTYIYDVRINSSTVKVFNEASTEIHSTPHTLVSGDIFRIELQAGFKLFMNNVLLHSRLGLGTTVVYPMTYIIGLFEPTASAPTRIPPPKLIGDWKLRRTVTWTNAVDGQLTHFGPFPETEFHDATIVGTYTITAAVESAADASGVQRATATIVIPALEILGPTSVEMQPGEKARFKTNYDKAQNALITWSVVSGGGSFTQDEFTAPSTPGDTTVRATALNGLSADIAIKVPAVITNINNYLAVAPGEVIDFNTNIPASMLPVFFGTGAVAEGTGDVIVGLHQEKERNDIMLLLVQSANQDVATPSGWTPVPDSPQAVGLGPATRLEVFWRRATLGEGPPTLTDPGDHALGIILVFRGCPTTGDPWDVTAGDIATSSTAVSIPGDTTTVNNCLIVAIVAHATDTATPQASGFANAALSNLAEVVDISTALGVGGGLAVAVGGKATAGPIGATTATLANASIQARMFIALKPGSPIWTASVGSIDSSTGIWTAPSLAGQVGRIAITNGIFTATVEIPVLEVFPLNDPSLPLTRVRKLNSLIGMSEDRKRRSTRDKSSPYDAYEVKFLSRSLDEAEAVEAFFDEHRFGKLFIFEDKVRDVRKICWFDSEINYEMNDNCSHDISFRFLEAKL